MNRLPDGTNPLAVGNRELEEETFPAVLLEEEELDNRLEDLTIVFLNLRDDMTL